MSLNFHTYIHATVSGFYVQLSIILCAIKAHTSIFSDYSFNKSKSVNKFSVVSSFIFHSVVTVAKTLGSTMVVLLSDL